MTGIELLGLFFLALLSIYFYQKLQNKDLPPGPWGFPIVGHLPLLGSMPYKTVFKWTQSKRFGSIISLNFGSYRTVVINDVKLIKEAFNDSRFSGRPDIKFFRDRSGGTTKGILFTDGQKWLEQRRFTLRHLRDFGFGKKSMEVIMLEEVSELIDTFKKQSGKPIPIRHAFNAAIVNSIWNVLTGERFKQDDPELKKAIQLLTSNIQENNTLQGIATFLPWVATLFPTLSGYTNIIKDVEPVLNFLRKPLDYLEKTFQDGEHRGFMDVYIQEMRNTSDPKSPFHPSNSDILWVLVDLFIAGAETTSTTLSWTFLYLSKFPEVQNKLHCEIDKVIGNSRLPSLSDRAEMPYTQAVIHEVLRYASIAPFAIFHNTTGEVKLGGFTIPKDTMVIPNLYAASFDENYWVNPEAFNPDRFINDKGEFEKNDAFVAFSVGKRQCLGETLARDELFLFTTSLFQKFVITSEIKPSDLDLDPVVSQILSPKQYNFILKERVD